MPNSRWALGYILNNSWLKIRQSSIGSTLSTVPFPHVWDGSLGTLFYEFLCYLILAALALVGLLKHHLTVLVLAGASWATEIVIGSVPRFNAQFGLLHHWDEYKMLTFVPVFLTGSVIFLYRDKIADSGWFACGCLAGCLVSFAIPLGSSAPASYLTSFDMIAPLLVYPVLWLGIHLPLEQVGARNDYSYGIYIYAWPVQQMLALWGVNRWGYVPYTALTLTIAVPCAIASWWLVEKQALKLKATGLSYRRSSNGPPATVGGLVEQAPH
jgi:peptidoglycan/LPS O-acetylase OafA/YrhL